MKNFAKITAVLMLVVMSMALLVSCGPATNPDKAVECLKNNEYAAVKLSGAVSTGAVALLLGLKGEDVTAIVTGSKVDDNGDAQGVFVIYFKDAATANSVMKKAQENINKIVSALNLEYEDGSDVKKQGAMIYSGTEAGIKAAR